MGLLERIVAMLTKLGQRGYAVHEDPAEYATWLDSDSDPDTDGEHEQTDRQPCLHVTPKGAPQAHDIKQNSTDEECHSA